MVVFLDYDGTLTPIVDRPEEAYLSDAMRSALASVAARYHTAIVTGRAFPKVFDFVKLHQLCTPSALGWWGVVAALP